MKLRVAVKVLTAAYADMASDEKTVRKWRRVRNTTFENAHKRWDKRLVQLKREERLESEFRLEVKP